MEDKYARLIKSEKELIESKEDYEEEIVKLEKEINDLKQIIDTKLKELDATQASSDAHNAMEK